MFEFHFNFRHSHVHGYHHNHSHSHGRSHSGGFHGHSHNANMEGKFYLAECLVFYVIRNTDLVAVFSYSKNFRSTCFSLDTLTLTVQWQGFKIPINMTAGESEQQL
jgi:hypothetical protein